MPLQTRPAPRRRPGSPRRLASVVRGGVLGTLLGTTLAACAGPQLRPDDTPGPDGLLIEADGDRIPTALPAAGYTGEGIYLFPDGDVYRGDFVVGLPQGRGTLERADGGRYSGDWVRGRREGEGVLVLAEGGGRYEGEFLQDRRHGRGRFESPRGTYDGEWFRDLPQGRGVYEYANGDRYEGEWYRGTRNGWGELVQPDGERYEGEWRNDVPHGFGRLSAANGHSLEGEWNQGSFEGYGVYEDRRGIRYEGMWRDGRRDGYGRETWPNGAVFEGEYADGRRQGRGVWRAGSGETFSGRWIDGRPDGPGTRRSVDGIVTAGDWDGATLREGTVELPGGARYQGPMLADGPGALASGGSAALAPAYRVWLRQRATDGDPHASFVLAVAHLEGRVPEPSPDRARALLRTAAEGGVASAQIELARRLIDEGTTGEGILLLRRAAAAGDARAHLVLGTYAQTGEHVPRDHRAALEHYRTAADTGDVTAQNNLAWLLSTSPESEVRDGDAAVEIMLPLVHFTSDWGHYDTLAAAYAEIGEFDAALEWQTRALEDAGSNVPEPVLRQMRERLALYRRGRPWRE